MSGKVYRIYDDIGCYIGSTRRSLNNRLWHHKKDQRTKRECTSVEILDRGCYKCEILEDGISPECLKQKEQYWIENSENVVNKIRAYRTEEQKNEYNREYQRKYESSGKRKEYLEKNKDKKREYHKKYSQENPEKYREYSRRRREKPEVKEYMKKYRQENWEKLNKKIICECGKLVSIKGIKRHRTTNNHMKLLSQQE